MSESKQSTSGDNKGRGKLRLRVGDVEVECEGSEEFLREEVTKLLETAMGLRAVSRQSRTESSDGDDKQSVDRDDSGADEPLALTTTAIAAKLEASSGADLLKSAVASLTLVKRRETLPREDILGEMQNATAYYKSSYSNNLSKYITTLMKAGFLSETATNVYSMAAAARRELTALLRSPV